MIREILMCFRGPRLYRIYPQDAKLPVVDPYDSNRLERYGDLTINAIHVMNEIMKYGSPLLIPYLYRREMFTPEGAVLLMNFAVAVSLAYALAWTSRGLGRSINPSYRSFLSELELARSTWNASSGKDRMLKYDFEFFAWPVEYEAPHCSPYEPKRKLPFKLLSLPLKPLSWILAHTLGLALVYPGSTALLQAGMHPALMHGRASLIRRYSGRRYKIRTCDGNTVDTMYIHRRDSPKGKTLIINCEGNGGYYEIGVTSPAVDSGFSVLGWNHPGFGWSTGRPFPDQERNASDAVLQFAIHRLGYDPSDIIIYGWSIGGFTASWLASRYPDVKCIVLDATFDVLLPLAVSRMPRKLAPLIEDAVSTYIDLNVSEQLGQYQGVVRLIRRSQDEMIVTDMDDPSTNRANNLLQQLLTARYPHIINESLLWDYLKLKPGGKEQFVSKLNMNEALLNEILSGAKEEPYPLALGSKDSSSKLSQENKNQLTIFLAQKYMLDYDSSHCTALPLSYLEHVHREAEEAITL